MKKYLALCCMIFGICGFESLSDSNNEFEIENKTTAEWETELSGTTVKAYNKRYELELDFDASPFMPSSTLCISNKRIKDIKFTVNIYKKMQKGDTKFAKMVERMRINFMAPGISKEKRVYTSTLIGDRVTLNIGDTVPVGKLYFLAPITCNDVNQMRMRITDINVQGRSVPPLEILFKLTK